jgi:hypothetical protein
MFMGYAFSEIRTEHLDIIERNLGFKGLKLFMALYEW